jgi:hypothetical protein
LPVRQCGWLHGYQCLGHCSRLARDAMTPLVALFVVVGVNRGLGRKSKSHRAPSARRGVTTMTSADDEAEVHKRKVDTMRTPGFTAVDSLSRPSERYKMAQIFAAGAAAIVVPQFYDFCYQACKRQGDCDPLICCFEGECHQAGHSEF